MKFVAPNCAACKRMDETLADLTIQQQLAAYEVVRLGVEQDTAWRLFEDLELAATPAFVTVTADGRIDRRVQGLQSRDAFLDLLRPR